MPYNKFLFLFLSSRYYLLCYKTMVWWVHIFLKPHFTHWGILENKLMYSLFFSKLFVVVYNWPYRPISPKTLYTPFYPFTNGGNPFYNYRKTPANCRWSKLFILDEPFEFDKQVLFELKQIGIRYCLLWSILFCTPRSYHFFVNNNFC